MVFVTPGWSLGTSGRTMTRWRSATWPLTLWLMTQSTNGKSILLRETGSGAPLPEAAGTTLVRRQNGSFSSHHLFIYLLYFFKFDLLPSGIRCTSAGVNISNRLLTLCIFSQTHSGQTPSSSWSWRTLTTTTTCAAWWSLWCRRTGESWGRKAWTWRPSASQFMRSEIWQTQTAVTCWYRKLFFVPLFDPDKGDTRQHNSRSGRL